MNNIRSIHNHPVPAHLTPVNDLVITLDSDRVFGSLLQNLISSGQAFSMRTLTDEKPIAHEDLMVSGAKIVLNVQGPGYTVEEIRSPVSPDLTAWRFDDLVRYRIVDHHRANSGALYLDLMLDPQNPFADYADRKDRIDDAIDEALESSPKQQLRELQDDWPSVIRLLGGMLVDVAAEAAAGDFELERSSAFKAALDAIGADEDEQEQLMDMVDGATLAGRAAADLAIRIVHRTLTSPEPPVAPES